MTTATPSRSSLEKPKSTISPLATIVGVIVAVVLGMVVYPAAGDFITEAQLTAAGPFDYSSKKLGFSAQFPGEPEVTTATESTAGVEVELTSVMWESPTRSMGVAVAEVESLGIPDPSTLVPAGADALLKSMLDGAVANIKGGVLLDYDYGVVAGARSIHADMDSDAGKLSVTLLVANGSFFTILANSDDDADETAFIRSFGFVSD